MSERFIYKPYPDNAGKGVVFLAPSGGDRSPPTITDSEGNSYTGKFYNEGHHGYQFTFDPILRGKNDLTLNYGGTTTKLAKGSMSYRGDDLSSLVESSKGGGSGLGGSQQIGEYGVAPQDLTSLYPSPFLMDAAPYNFTDPFKFAEKYGDFSRNQLRKNFDVSKDLSLSTLDAELEGLSAFVPAASALKRSETSADNIFNQAQRTRQIQSTLPGVTEDLEGQAGRARDYASGRIPDAVQDRAFELGIRSAAADRASGGGFGSSSSAARKASDLMSAGERVKLSQYGDELLTGNIVTKSNLLLAPTEYSNAGQQVQVMPSLSPSQLIQSNFGELNQYGAVSATNALSSQIDQNKFKTNLEQETRKFNTTNQNNFALGKFDYMANLAGAVAGAGQTNINTQVALDQQQKQLDYMMEALKKAQSAAQTGAITSAIGQILFGTKYGSQIASSLSGLFGGGGSSASSDFGVPSSFGTNTTNPISGSPTGANPILDQVSAESPDSIYNKPSQDVSEFGSDYLNNDYSQPSDLGGDQPFSMYAKSAPMQAKALVQDAKAIEAATGVSRTQEPGTQFTGYNNSGKPMYAKMALLNSKDVQAGAAHINTFKDVVAPFKVLDEDQTNTLNKIAGVSSDVATLDKLNTYWQKGDKKGFVTELASAFGPRVIAKSVGLEKLPKNATPEQKAKYKEAKAEYEKYSTALNGAVLFSNWGKYSNAQKGLGLASFGINAYKVGTDIDLSKKVIPGTGEGGNPALTVGQSLDLLSAGYNAYTLAKNWNQMNALQKVTGGVQTANQIAQTAKGFNLLGAGTEGAAVSTSAEALASVGAVATPSMGIGAVTVSSASQVPAGYTAVASGVNGGVVAVPTANAGSAAAAQPGFVPGLQLGAGAVSFATGAYQVYKGWGQGGKEGRLNGAIGGSAMAAGLYAMSGPLGYASMANPYVLGAVVATSIISNSIKVGKSGDQSDRDQVRGAFKSAGLVGDDYKVKLADGSTFDIGIDGHGAQHEFTNPDKATGKKGGKLNAWDLDYTNDLDYASGMAGSALSRLLSGGVAKNIDQLGSQLGNAGLGNVGFKAEMTQGNFDKVMANQRAFYAQSGIKSKADAYQLINQGFAEGRWDESQTVAMQQAANMMYDKDGFKTAQSLMGGRWKGIEVAASSEVTQDNKGASQVKVVNPVSKGTREAAQASGRNKSAPSGKQISIGGTPTSELLKQGPITKEQLLEINRAKYGRGGRTDSSSGSLFKPQYAD
jgi:hypothetical protein